MDDYKTYKVEVTVKAVFYEEARDKEEAMRLVFDEFQYVGVDEITFDKVTEMEGEN